MKNGHTQVTLAKALGVHPIAVARWEIGTRRIPSFLHLALDALECKGGEPLEGGRKRKGVKHGKG